MEISSIEGYQYFITFTDDHSRYTCIRLCKSKDDTLGVFKAWKARAEKEMGKSLKILHTDGRGEYTSSAFNAYLAKHGIKHKVMNAYTPQENGVSEHANQTINNLACSMMADIKEVLKSKSLFPCGLRPSNTQSGSKSISLPDHSTERPNLCLFGCKAYAHTLKVSQTKFGECTTKCIHVRFAGGGEAYLLYNRECQWLLESHNVEFEEIDTREHITVDLDSDADNSITPGAETGDPGEGQRSVDPQETPKAHGDDDRDVPNSPTEHLHPHHPFQPLLLSIDPLI